MKTFDFTPLDEALWSLYEETPPSRRWLLKQTVLTAPARRAVLANEPTAVGQHILDIGCGFGLPAIERAIYTGATVTGIDTDKQVLALAQRLAQAWSPARNVVTFTEKNVYELTDVGLYDGAIARFVFQHLVDPAASLRSIKRALKPGGFLLIEDVDDAWQTEDPPPPPSWEAILEAFRSLQHLRGGNREVGRMLPRLLSEAGYHINSVQVFPWAAWERFEDPSHPAMQFEWERIVAEVPEMLEHKLITLPLWNQAVADWQSGFPRSAFVANATIHVRAQVPIKEASSTIVV